MFLWILILYVFLSVFSPTRSIHSVTQVIQTRFILSKSTHLLRYTLSPYDSMPQSYALQLNTSVQNKIFDLKSSNFVRLQGSGSRNANAFQ